MTHLEDEVRQSDHEPAKTILLTVREDEHGVQGPLSFAVLRPVSLGGVQPSLILLVEHKEVVCVDFLHQKLGRQGSQFFQKKRDFYGFKEAP